MGSTVSAGPRYTFGWAGDAEEILADIANYTDQSPVIQISEVVVG